jgi:CBS domain-containing protein
MSTVAAILKHKGYQVSTVDPTMRVSEVAQILSERRIGAVLVVDNTEQMLGIVSERDIVRVS